MRLNGAETMLGRKNYWLVDVYRGEKQLWSEEPMGTSTPLFFSKRTSLVCSLEENISAGSVPCDHDGSCVA